MLKLNRTYFGGSNWWGGNFSSSLRRPEKSPVLPDTFYIPLDSLNIAPGIDCHLNSWSKICQSDLIMQMV